MIDFYLTFTIFFMPFARVSFAFDTPLSRAAVYYWCLGGSGLQFQLIFSYNPIPTIYFWSSLYCSSLLFRVIQSHFCTSSSVDRHPQFTKILFRSEIWYQVHTSGLYIVSWALIDIHSVFKALIAVFFFNSSYPFK